MALDAPVFSSYDLELDTVFQKLQGRDEIETVALQFPDGLRDHATDVAAVFEDRLETDMIISADPSFGACDVALNLEPYADALVHFGHTEMPSVEDAYDFEVHFVAARHKAPVGPVAVDAAEALRAEHGVDTVGVFTTAQHGHKLEEALEALEEAGFTALVGHGDDRVAGAGQVLGCNYTAATSVHDDVEGFVYLGSGDFHPVAVRFSTELPMALADPYTEKVRDVEETYDRLMRQRYAAIGAARDAQSWGVLAGTHVGQSRFGLARGLVDALRRDGYEAHLVALQFFSWQALQNFRHLDAFVNTGCPRITTDDVDEYPMPMLTPPEMEIAIGRKDLDEYRFDEFMGSEPRPKGEAGVAMVRGPGETGSAEP